MSPPARTCSVVPYSTGRRLSFALSNADREAGRDLYVSGPAAWWRRYRPERAPKASAIVAGRGRSAHRSPSSDETRISTCRRIRPDHARPADREVSSADEEVPVADGADLPPAGSLRHPHHGVATMLDPWGLTQRVKAVSADPPNGWAVCAGRTNSTESGPIQGVRWRGRRDRDAARLEGRDPQDPDAGHGDVRRPPRDAGSIRIEGDGLPRERLTCQAPPKSHSSTPCSPR